MSRRTGRVVSFNWMGFLYLVLLILVAVMTWAR